MAGKNQGTKVVLTLTSTILHLMLTILFYIVVVIFVVKGSRLAYQYSYQVFGSVSVSEGAGKDYGLKISEGESTMNVSTKLEQNGIIVNRFTFYIRAKLTKQNILPGTYTVNSSMDYDDIFKVIASGSRAEESETK